MNKVRFDMMRLWKDTFADADDYISIVFDSYFNPKMCFTIYTGDKLLSSMLCVEYMFYNKRKEMKCAYQCGLATLPEYRNRGMMRGLIERANNTLYDNKFVMSFLIPADDGLRQYYKKSGYVEASFVNEDKYVCKHQYLDDEIQFISNHAGELLCNCAGLKYEVYNVSDVFNNVCTDDLNIRGLKRCGDICNSLHNIYIKFISLLENVSNSVLKYSFDDFVAICLDYYISHGKILCLTDDNSKPLSILFCSNTEEGRAMVRLQVSTSEEAEQILLQILKYLLPRNTALTVRRYAGEVTGSRHEVSPRPYAMAKILNVREVLKFVAASYLNSEFSILVINDPIRENEGLYEVRQGRVQFTPKESMSPGELHGAMMKCGSRADWFVLTVPELAGLLFRRPDGADNSESAMAIPRLSPVVALVLE